MNNQSSLSQYSASNGTIDGTLLPSLSSSNDFSDFDYQSNMSLLLSNIISNSSNDNSDMNYDLFEIKDYIFDRTGVRVIFITLYSLVFCCCFFGELKLRFF